jgi:hypothetical protein
VAAVCAIQALGVVPQQDLSPCLVVGPNGLWSNGGTSICWFPLALVATQARLRLPVLLVLLLLEFLWVRER